MFWKTLDAGLRLALLESWGRGPETLKRMGRETASSSWQPLPRQWARAER